jgi:CheY-like chemotaxis protein
MKTAMAQILLVEDNAADANLVGEALAEARVDCQLCVVRDGAQAIAFLERAETDPCHPQPDVVLLDLNLPKVSGEEVLKRVRLSPSCSAVKVLIVSSSDAPADRERAMALGASDYFRKPSDLEQYMTLGPRVRAMLAGEPAG